MPLAESLPLLRAWCDAEVEADVDALDALTVPDFAMVGPFGFVLAKPAWLDRYRTGDLVTTDMSHTVDDTRDYGPSRIVIGTVAMTATHRGRPAGGAFRSTHVVVETDGRLVLAGLHLSLRHPPERPAVTQ